MSVAPQDAPSTDDGVRTVAASLPIEDPRTTALLVIDMQADFIGEDARFPIDRARVARLIAKVNAAIDEARARGALVVHIAQGDDVDAEPCERGDVTAPHAAGTNPRQVDPLVRGGEAHPSQLRA